MQAIEIETEITNDGHIRLPKSLEEVYGRHARLILLFDPSAPASAAPLASPEAQQPLQRRRAAVAAIKQARAQTTPQPPEAIQSALAELRR